MYRLYANKTEDLISIGNHMNSSAIWEIIALSHVFEEM